MSPLMAQSGHASATVAGDRNRGASKAFSCRAACGNGMSKRILVVDDQPDNRQIIRDRQKSKVEARDMCSPSGKFTTNPSADFGRHARQRSMLPRIHEHFVDLLR